MLLMAWWQENDVLMRFVHPQYLFFLLAILVPLIVHLFKLRRYKREYFSNVRLLRQIQQEQRKRAKLREYFVLACRILTIVCIVLAFAQPYVPQDESEHRNEYKAVFSIYLDNSFSMQAPAEDFSRVNQAKAYACSLLESMHSDASVQLLTNDFSGWQQQFYQPAELIRKIAGIGLSPFSPGFEEIEARQHALFDAASIPSSSCFFYYISDFQKSTWNFPLQKRKDSLVSQVFIPIEGRYQSNVSLDSIALESPVLQPGREIGLRVFLSNHSDKEQIQMPLRLFVDGRQIGAYPIDFKPEERVETKIPFRLEAPGFHTAYVEVADYPVEFDNRLFFSLNLEERLIVLHLWAGTASSSIAKVFQEDSSFLYQSFDIAQLDYGCLEKARLVIVEGLESMPTALESALESFVRKGGNLLLIPAAPSGLALADEPGNAVGRTSAAEGVSKSFLSDMLGDGLHPFHSIEDRLRWINRDHPLFSLALANAGQGEENEIRMNEAFPYVKAAYGLPFSPKGAYVSLMSFDLPQAGNGDSRKRQDFLRAYPVGNGWLYLLAAPLSLDYSDFANHYTFVVSLLNMALLQGGEMPLYYTIANRNTFYLPSALFKEQDLLYHIYSLNGTVDFMPEIRRRGIEAVLLFQDEVRQAGNYGLAGEPAGSSKVPQEYDCLWPLSFNYSRAESSKDCWSAEELQSWIERYGDARTYLLRPDKADMGESLARIERGKELWKVFLIFALVFALAETIALRKTSLH